MVKLSIACCAVVTLLGLLVCVTHAAPANKAQTPNTEAEPTNVMSTDNSEQDSQPESGAERVMLVSLEEKQRLFEQYVIKYKRNYKDAERACRFKNFCDYVELIKRHEVENPDATYKLGLNQFSDMSESERCRLLGTSTSSKKCAHSGPSCGSGSA